MMGRTPAAQLAAVSEHNGLGPICRFFTGLGEAERYAQSRPYFHPMAIERARDIIRVDGTSPVALDVACGTGQSTLALLPLADHVIGIDISLNMLTHAERNPRLLYTQARAEAMPFETASVPLMTTALAFHWFDRDPFLGEARRVLRPEGWLVIYNNAFRGTMKENPSFRDWGAEVYLKHYPTPPRESKPLAPEEASHAGFAFIEEDGFQNEVIFTPEELVAYLTTQTNVIAAIKDGRENLETAYAWLHGQVSSFFQSASGTFVFWTRAWYLKRQSAR